MQLNLREVLGGLLMFGLGLSVFAYSLLHYSIGSMARPGPGLFPAVIGFAVVGIGVLIVVRGAVAPIAEMPKIEWRNALLITLSVVAFGLTFRRLGVAPSAAITVFIATLADRSMTHLARLATVIALTLLVVIIFKFGVGIRVPLIAGVIY